MARAEERMQILKMIENKQITAEEGARLLAALEQNESVPGPGGPTPAASTQGRRFHVRVTDLRTGKRKVNVNIPLGLVNVGMKMGAKLTPEGAELLDMKQIMAAVQAGGQGKILDVEDEKGGEHVEVFIE